MTRDFKISLPRQWVSGCGQPYSRLYATNGIVACEWSSRPLTIAETPEKTFVNGGTASNGLAIGFHRAIKSET